MTQTSYLQPAAEYAAIHLAACRYRRQGLACSSCSAALQYARPIAFLGVR